MIMPLTCLEGLPVSLAKSSHGHNVCVQEHTRDNSKEAESFREQLNTRSAEYVEEILSPHFGGILQFVKEGEALVEKGQAEELKHHESKCCCILISCY